MLKANCHERCCQIRRQHGAELIAGAISRENDREAARPAQSRVSCSGCAGETPAGSGILAASGAFGLSAAASGLGATAFGLGATAFGLGAAAGRPRLGRVP